MKSQKIRKIVFSGLLLALGMVLPFATMQIPRLGNMLLPMHIPVLLCGYLCGGGYGLIVGAILPLLRSLIFTAPPMMPTAVAMSVELATYGLLTGILYSKFKQKKFGIYSSLLIAMVVGRIVWGLVAFGLNHALGNLFTWKIFAMQAFVNAVPGIIIQLILIPAIVHAVRKVQEREG